MDTCIGMAESLCCSSETITTVFVNQLYPYKIKSCFFFLNKKKLRPARSLVMSLEMDLPPIEP